MRIVVVGSGGVGGYFGGLLANAGQHVTFIARGDHLAALRQHGLKVRSVHGDFNIASIPATDDIASAGPADLILVAVKDYQLDLILSALGRLVTSETTILPLLNGVRAAERLAVEFGPERAIGGLCFVVAYQEAPGIIRQESAFRRIGFGEWDGRQTNRVAAINSLFQLASIQSEPASDIRRAMWSKFLFITAYSGVASVVRLPAAGLRSFSETVTMLRSAIEEVAAVGRARGIDLPDNAVENAMAFFNGFPSNSTASMQRDVQAGRMFELEAMTGSVVRYGRETGVPTPVNDFIYAVLKPLEMIAASQNK